MITKRLRGKKNRVDPFHPRLILAILILRQSIHSMGNTEMMINTEALIQDIGTQDLHQEVLKMIPCVIKENTQIITKIIEKIILSQGPVSMSV